MSRAAPVLVLVHAPVARAIVYRTRYHKAPANATPCATDRRRAVPGTLEAKVVIQSSDQTMGVNVTASAPEPDWVRKSMAAVKGPNAARPNTADEMRA